MSGKRAKRIRKAMRDEKVTILRKYISDVKSFSLKPRIQIAWSILKGMKPDRFKVMVAFMVLVVVGLCGMGVWKIVELVWLL
jgi:hypothetical protein